MRSSTVVYGGRRPIGSLIEELRRREEAARVEADGLRARIGELSGDLARAEEQVARLVIAREEITSTCGRYWKNSRPGSIPARRRVPAGSPGPGWRPGPAGCSPRCSARARGPGAPCR